MDKLSELLRELQMLRVTREVQAVISNGQPGRADAGVPTFHPAAQELQTLENLMKHNDRYSILLASALPAMFIRCCFSSLSRGPLLISDALGLGRELCCQDSIDFLVH